MRKEDWEKVETRLSELYCSVELEADGYHVKLTLVRADTYKNVIIVIINGELRTEWLIEECEESRRFFRPRKKCLLGPKERKQVKKMSKAKRQAIEEKMNYKYYEMYWTSFPAMKRHFMKNNDEIILIK